MTALLSFYWIWDYEDKKVSVGVQEETKKSIRFTMSNAFDFVPLVILVILQATQLFHKGDSALTSEGRVWRLHMWDSRAVCLPMVRIHRKIGADQSLNLYDGTLAARIRCDPLVYYNFAKNKCVELKADANFVDLDLSLKSKRPNENLFHLIIDYQGFCSHQPDYSGFWGNSWIQDKESSL
jgi:hypothetical protein